MDQQKKVYRSRNHESKKKRLNNVHSVFYKVLSFEGKTVWFLFQQAVAFDHNLSCDLAFSLLSFCSIKKSGKTAL